ncbi:glycosyltransferase [Phytohabitans suffuscus]|nr:nucleotide disphospho-sugar-binding domain-containing protein [Phytohabitans suffuscus]
MRVLVTAVPAIGHFLPVVPLAVAFRAAGHEVLVALAQHADFAARAGLPVVDVAPDYDAVAVTSQVLKDDPAFLENVWNVTVTPRMTIAPRAPMFAGINRPLVPATVELADQWRPDLVVYEQTATVGPMVAARLGIPAVQQNIAILASGDMHRATAALLGDLCDKYEIPPLPDPLMTVEALPPSMLSIPAEGPSLGGRPYNGGGVLGSELPRRPERPQVAVTLGSGFSAGFYGLGALEPVIAAAAEVDADFLIALGEAAAGRLGPLPPNVRSLDRWFPYSELFRTCAAAIHHGGGGSIMTSIDAGIPQMVVRGDGDPGALIMGDAVRDRGLGISTTPPRSPRPSWSGCSPTARSSRRRPRSPPRSPACPPRPPSRRGWPISSPTGGSPRARSLLLPPGTQPLLPPRAARLGVPHRGHEVIVSIADCAPAAAGSGLEIVDVAPDFDMNAVNERVAAEHPDLMAAMATKPMVEPEDWAAGIAAVNRPLVPGSIALADDWRPDLVVYDQASTVGLLVADRLGVPAVQQNIGSLRTGRMHEAIADHLADLCAEYAVTAGKPATTLETFPPSLLDRPAEGPFMRWVPYNGGTVVSGRLPAPPDARPRVAIAMGTTELTELGLDALASVVEAVAPVDADFVLAAGDVDLTALGTLPANIRRVGWTPMSSLLRTCTALIHHGGGGNVLNAVAANLPQLIAHDPANLMHHTTCAVVRKSGIGLVTPSDRIDRPMVEALLTNDALRRAAGKVHAENESLPSPAATARSIAERTLA